VVPTDTVPASPPTEADTALPVGVKVAPRKSPFTGEYRLMSISASAFPAGLDYKYVPERRVWVDKSSGGDVMSYMQMNDITDPSQVPDLSSPLNDRISRALSGFRIVNKVSGDSLLIDLIAGRKVIHAFGVPLDELEGRTTAELKFRKLNGSRFEVNLGALILQRGADYSLKFGETVSLDYRGDDGGVHLEYGRER
jgi:hypothetical protein